KPIDDGLDLEQPFDEREVRDSECLVYKQKEVAGFSDFFLLVANSLILSVPGADQGLFAPGRGRGA
ncbi:MAG: hypothetical protein II719_02195, partial [Clostridia bacterium]|nr:hypothetical protein [Clostridia bacterium]